MVRLLICASLAVIVLGCSQKPELTPEQQALRNQIVLVDPTTVRGVRYIVSAKRDKPGHFDISTVDRRPGTRDGVVSALRREFGCTSIDIVSHNRNWSDTEAKGAFCTGGTSVYRY